jgi:hypothetical protein
MLVDKVITPYEDYIVFDIDFLDKDIFPSTLNLSLHQHPPTKEQILEFAAKYPDIPMKSENNIIQRVPEGILGNIIKEEYHNIEFKNKKPLFKGLAEFCWDQLIGRACKNYFPMPSNGPENVFFKEDNYIVIIDGGIIDNEISKVFYYSVSSSDIEIPTEIPEFKVQELNINLEFTTEMFYISTLGPKKIRKIADKGMFFMYHNDEAFIKLKPDMKKYLANLDFIN